MSNMLEQLRSSATIIRAAQEDSGVAARLKDHIRDRSAANGWTRADEMQAMLEMMFAEQWVKHGAIVYELTHSMAALFALTSAPRLDWTRTPHPYFLVKVPRAFFPIANANPAQDTWVLAGPRSAIVVPDWDTTAVCSMVYPIVTETPDDFRAASAVNGILGFDATANATNSARRAGELCGRFLANAVAYIIEHRESSKQDFAARGDSSPVILRPPSDVVITKAFRDAASAVSAAHTLAGTRRALAHVVRGHWRNQAIGPAHSERKLIWIHPHKRGDESLGRVVSRIERLHATP